MTPWFFGYGSLVNRATHAYPQAQAATLNGWRRAWVRTDRRNVVFLSVQEAPGHSIDGLIASVPQADWAALDLRETGYTRINATHAVAHEANASDIAVYQVPPDAKRPAGDHRILLSYLDVVVQGFVREFGQAGAEHFFATTDGWDTAIQDDRGAPLYPRAQTLTPQEQALTDRLLAQVQ
ncbi:gamma-glutamylcyclotransferase family protein [Tateyamaria omphalii]|uniref:Gamma-glutamylcyclotransferase n=1 Tax=Tateyamaria omphalii TaxID=299262 RepID=A0A1P8MZR1_9RHOB|nr:gamma-glutamylcyclotransferase family protein [Tateyamaria omphalii]APX13544.1 gamma-glutamylcyclotransferase [Tateyamaria omphalii]